MAACKKTREWNTPRLSCRLVSLAKNPSTALIHEAEVGGGSVHVAWHRGGELFPHPIEVHQAGAPILGMQPRLASLAEDWDGTDLARPMIPVTEESHR